MIYTISILKSINVLHAKMVLKTHLFIKNILLSLQKLCQYYIYNYIHIYIYIYIHIYIYIYIYIYTFKSHPVIAFVKINM